MKIREVASGLQFPEGPIALEDGSVLLVEIARGTLSRVTPDGRIHVVADLGGGPNGAAIGPDGAVYVCNNGGFRYVNPEGNCLRPVAQADVRTIADALRRAAGSRQDPIIVINADAKATHQSVVDVMQAAQSAGYPHISFATQAPH